MPETVLLYVLHRDSKYDLLFAKFSLPSSWILLHLVFFGCSVSSPSEDFSYLLTDFLNFISGQDLFYGILGREGTNSSDISFPRKEIPVVKTYIKEMYSN